MIDAHVVPAGDLIEHDTSVETGEDCICGPKIGPDKRPDGSIDWIAVHASLDGREASE